MPEKKETDLVNERIRFPQVMLIGPNGEQLGVMSSRDAYMRAIDYELDLLCVAPNAKPPVCKILNYGKYRFEAQKKAKENKRNQALHMVELKEIQLTPQIGEHDLMTKANRAKEFLTKGDKVKENESIDIDLSSGDLRLRFSPRRGRHEARERKQKRSLRHQELRYLSVPRVLLRRGGLLMNATVCDICGEPIYAEDARYEMPDGLTVCLCPDCLEDWAKDYECPGTVM